MGSCLYAFKRRKPFTASIMPAAVQRNAIAALRHRFTLRLTRRTVPSMFSIALVQASERRSGVGSERRGRCGAGNGQILCESFKDAGGDPRRLVVEPACKIAQ